MVYVEDEAAATAEDESIAARELALAELAAAEKGFATRAVAQTILWLVPHQANPSLAKLLE